MPDEPKKLSKPVRIFLFFVCGLTLLFYILFFGVLFSGEVDSCLDTGGGWDSKQETCFYSCKYTPGKKDCIPSEYLHQLQDCLDDGGGWDTQENICRPD